MPTPAASRLLRALLSAALSIAASPCAADSRCFGTVANGRLEGGVALPDSGPNFSAYSALGVAAGRTHVHAKVAEIFAAAYGAVAATAPELHFVYGETGWPRGGRLRPHKTHQNGTSIDFFVPVRDAANRSVPLPTPVSERFGYDIEFDAGARWNEYRIDFEALAEHLYQLDVAARSRGSGLALVIFDPRYMDRLLATKRGADLRRLPFMKGRPWVRHDEHYHVDFRIACRPL